MMMDWEKQALHLASTNVVNTFEHGVGDVAQLKHTMQELVTQLGGTLQVKDMQPGLVALYLTALYLKKVTEP